MKINEPTPIRFLLPWKHNGLEIVPGTRLQLPRNLAIWLIEKKVAELDRLAVPTSAAIVAPRAALLSRPVRRGCCGR